jgi:hypothetical protein
MNPATFPPSITELCVLTLMRCWGIHPNDMWKIPGNVVTQQAAKKADDPKWLPYLTTLAKMTIGSGSDVQQMAIGATVVRPKARDEPWQMSVEDIRKVIDGLWENVEGGVAGEDEGDDEDGDEDEDMDETTEDDLKGKVPKSVARKQAQRNQSKRKRDDGSSEEDVNEALAQLGVWK